MITIVSLGLFVLLFCPFVSGGIAESGGKIVVSYVQMDTEGIGGVSDHNDWASSGVWRGATYDFGINIAASVPVSDVILHLKVMKTGICADDLELQYFNESDEKWSKVALSDLGDALEGVVALPWATFPEAELTVPFLITFDVSGHYDSEIWATALEA